MGGGGRPGEKGEEEDPGKKGKRWGGGWGGGR